MGKTDDFAPSNKPGRSGKADPEQFARFVEAAKELGCEENFAEFERALPRVLRSPPQPAKAGLKAGKKGGSAE